MRSSVAAADLGNLRIRETHREIIYYCIELSERTLELTNLESSNQQIWV
jgi:hypothetical protein